MTITFMRRWLCPAIVAVSAAAAAFDAWALVMHQALLAIGLIGIAAARSKRSACLVRPGAPT